MTNLPAVFLDRDGTINEEAGYIHNLDDLRLITGAAQAIKKLNAKGILTILITNQSGPARGYYPEEHVINLNNRLLHLLMEETARLDRMYYCPHLPEGKVIEYSIDCNCRKPKPGMIQQALQDNQKIDIQKSYMIGDKSVDIDLAYNVGCKGILVKTGQGTDTLTSKRYPLTNKPHYIAEDISDAIDWLLEDMFYNSP